MPRFQRNGIGSSLLDTVVRYCRKKGCHKISLNTLPVLRPALNFYLKKGFVPEAFLRKQWWKVDFIFMSKWLD
ncbi:MAG: GNAT family N-acetyltransferase [Candidatus Methanofastidiosia archaeon]